MTQESNTSATGGDAPKPFTIEVPQEKLDRLRDRVARYPWETLDDLGDWRFGPPIGYIRRVAEHWLSSYDWRAAECELNRFPQFKARVGGGADGVELHFVHERGSGTDPGAVVLIHGWPSSPYDFWEMIEPLAHPERFGGDPEDGVDVVVPSVAGYGWSGRPPGGPQGRRREAAQVHGLMTDVLGYGRYVAGGGDFGAMISAWAAVDHPEAVRGVHVHAPNVRPYGGGFFETNPPEDLTQEEREYLFWEVGYIQQRLSYAALQGASPQTFAYAMMDSPVGQAAWLLEKFQRWTDESGGAPDEIFGMDRLLTAVMIYLVTDSFDTSIWAYPGVYLDPPTLEPGQRVEVPVGVVACADPLVPVPPRSFVERAYNVARWTDMPEAGHFAAFQRPGPLLEDLRGFLRQIREGS